MLLGRAVELHVGKCARDDSAHLAHSVIVHVYQVKIQLVLNIVIHTIHER